MPWKICHHSQFINKCSVNYKQGVLVNMAKFTSFKAVLVYKCCNVDFSCQTNTKRLHIKYICHVMCLSVNSSHMDCNTCTRITYLFRLLSKRHREVNKTTAWTYAVSYVFDEILLSEDHLYDKLPMWNVWRCQLPAVVFGLRYQVAVEVQFAYLTVITIVGKGKVWRRSHA